MRVYCICMYVYICVCMHICMHECMHVCIIIYVYVYMPACSAFIWSDALPRMPTLGQERGRERKRERERQRERDREREKEREQCLLRVINRTGNWFLRSLIASARHLFIQPSFRSSFFLLTFLLLSRLLSFSSASLSVLSSVHPLHILLRSNLPFILPPSSVSYPPSL